jgi:hypothetical protein
MAEDDQALIKAIRAGVLSSPALQGLGDYDDAELDLDLLELEQSSILASVCCAAPTEEYPVHSGVAEADLHVPLQLHDDDGAMDQREEDIIFDFPGLVVSPPRAARPAGSRSPGRQQHMPQPEPVLDALTREQQELTELQEEADKHELHIPGEVQYAMSVLGNPGMYSSSMPHLQRSSWMTSQTQP